MKVFSWGILGVALVVAVTVIMYQTDNFDREIRTPLTQAQSAGDPDTMLQRLNVLQVNLERWGASNEVVYNVASYTIYDLETLPAGITPDERMDVFRSWLVDIPDMRGFVLIRNASWLFWVGSTIAAILLVIAIVDLRRPRRTTIASPY